MRAHVQGRPSAAANASEGASCEIVGLREDANAREIVSSCATLHNARYRNVMVRA